MADMSDEQLGALAQATAEAIYEEVGDDPADAALVLGTAYLGFCVACGMTEQEAIQGLVVLTEPDDRRLN